MGWLVIDLMLISIIALFTSVRPLEILLLGGNKPATAAL